MTDTGERACDGRGAPPHQGDGACFVNPLAGSSPAARRRALGGAGNAADGAVSLLPAVAAALRWSGQYTVLEAGCVFTTRTSVLRVDRDALAGGVECTGRDSCVQLLGRVLRVTALQRTRGWLGSLLGYAAGVHAIFIAARAAAFVATHPSHPAATLGVACALYAAMCFFWWYIFFCRRLTDTWFADLVEIVCRGSAAARAQAEANANKSVKIGLAVVVACIAAIGVASFSGAPRTRLRWALPQHSVALIAFPTYSFERVHSFLCALNTQ